MSLELAQWLTEHQQTLLSRWVAQAAPNALTSLSHKGRGAGGEGLRHEPIPFTTANGEDIDRITNDMYQHLVLAAQGDRTALHTLGAHLNADTFAYVPQLLELGFQLRRAAWDMLQADMTEPTRQQALMDELIELVEYFAGVVTQAAVQQARHEIQERSEQAEFIAQSMTVAIEESDRTALQLSALNDVSQMLAASLDSTEQDQVIDLIGNQLNQLLDVAHIALWLDDESDVPDDTIVPSLTVAHDSTTRTLSLQQTWGSETHPLQGVCLLINPENEDHYHDLTIAAYLTGEILFEMQPEPEQQGIWYQPGYGVLALPLLVKERAIGVLVLQDPNPDDKLTRQQREVARTIVSQAAIVLDNIRLYAEIRRFNSELEQVITQRTSELQTEKDRLHTLHEISTEVSSTLDLDTLLETSLTALVRITSASYGMVMVIDQESFQLETRARLGLPEENLHHRLPMGTGIAGWVVEHKKPVIIVDVHLDERVLISDLTLDDDAADEQTLSGSLIAVPLIAHNEVSGVIIIGHPQKTYFNDDHLRMLTASAGAIALGIHNANLYLAIVSEMEYRSELLQRQRRETTQIQSILQSLSDGVVVCDADGDILLANPAASRILNYEIEQLLLSNLQTVQERMMPASIADMSLIELMQRPMNTNNEPRILEHTTRIDRHDVNLKLGPVIKENIQEDIEILGALLVIRDITRERQYDRLKTEFIGTMSHELRTPMTAIKGFTQMLAMGGLGQINDTQREILTTIQTNAERMISIINDVLSITKIETGAIDLEIRPLHLVEVLSGVVSELQSFISKRQHELHLSIPPGLPLIRADRTCLHQILFNILGNAVKYTPSEGEIWVEAYEANLDAIPGTVRDKIIAGRRYTRIDIRDTGVGIAAEEQERIFERFYRTENPLKVEAGGTGLGLSLTKPLIELLGGRIWLKSEINEGSTFSFILPAV
ncbi:MAG: GAF domain-containing protein [Chloroflexaceae bacterium]|nr:GAF domain-containing protein [Chloroflexaceae bacterium]